MDVVKTQSKLRTILLIVALFLGYIMIYIDKLSIGIALVPMSAEMGISPSAKGFIMSAFFLGYALMQIPMGFVNNKLGSKKILVFSIFMIGVFACLFGFGTSIIYFILIRFLAGAIAHSGYAASASKEVATKLPIGQRTFAQGILLSTSGIASAIGPMIVSPAVQSMGWVATYRLLAVIAVVIGLLLLIAIPNEKKAIVSEDVEVAPKVSLKTVWKNKQVWIFFFCAFFVNAIVYGITSWVPTFLTGPKGYTLIEAGNLASIAGACALVGAIVGSYVVGRWFQGNEKFVISVAAVIGAVGLFSAFYMETFATMALALAVADFALLITFVTLMSLPLKRFKSDVFAPSYATVATGGILGGVVSPSLIGLFVTASGGSFISVFTYFLILGLAMAATACLIPNLKKKKA
ncbi:MFS transporter [Periweissella cryptocerci]|uniref:MFS transporter n=1 Tax=Periweissella cryptocerci TaxID=2506420 RepID=A0A4P6YUR1_9LACO|nr:MFS transporter [Periweissella cryptocerci]QBO36492.1 MFS transporter [Periweissella cryptocerci]